MSMWSRKSSKNLHLRIFCVESHKQEPTSQLLSTPATQANDMRHSLYSFLKPHYLFIGDSRTHTLVPTSPQGKQMDCFSSTLACHVIQFRWNIKTCGFVGTVNLASSAPLVCSLLQWNSVNTVTNGPKKYSHINGVAVLSGQAQLSLLEGSYWQIHQEYTVHRIRFKVLFSLINNWNVDIAYRNWKKLLNISLQYMKLFENSAINRDKCILSVL